MSAETMTVVRARPDDERIRDARARLAQSRVRSRASLTALRTEITVQTDWRTWYRASPEIFLVAAFFAGFLLAKRR